ncbi:MAG: hypothetical protein JXR76_29645 [Deltaproteobacteria bacterium]|nr:hypothetical protein [Deltaproteobacteria bacterium]
MYKQVEKPKEKKSRAVAISVIENNKEKQGFGFVDNRPEVIRQRKLKAMIGNTVAQRVVSTSGVSYTPAPADLVYINALDAQIATAETDATNDVQNNPAPALHTRHQARYMANPTARGWGNCVEEKLNVWAGANGWKMANNGGGSNPDYSRVRGGTKIWADLTTAAEAAPGANHIIGKLITKVNSGANDSTWVAADVVHGGLNPVGAGQGNIVTNGIVSVAQSNAWQTLRNYIDGDNYDQLIERRRQQAEDIPSYATFSQSWDANRREAFRLWIDGSRDGDLDEAEYDSDEYDSDGDYMMR